MAGQWLWKGRAILTKETWLLVMMYGSVTMQRSWPERFSDEKIKQLLELKWWDWAPKKITENIQALTGNDVDHLLHRIKFEPI